MRRLSLILAAAALLAAAGEASASLCEKCRNKAYISSIGRCTRCKERTSSAAFKLCEKCSTRMNRCQFCLVAIGKPAKPPKPTQPPPADPTVKPLVLTAGDNGKTVSTQVGRKITVQLAGNITTGYSWSIATIAGTAVRLEGKITYKPSPAPRGMVGSGGMASATFQAVRTGKSVITMAYARRWEKNKKPARTFTVTIDVAPGTGTGNGAGSDTGAGGKALSPKAAKLAKLFKDNVAGFTLDIRYFGPQNRPYYQLTLRVPIIKDRRQRYWPAVRLSPDRANKIIDHLAGTGFFDRAIDTTRVGTAKPKGPAYTFWLSGPTGVLLYERIGWYRPMLDRFDALAKVLDGDAATQMGQLLGRLSSYRKRWPETTAKPKTRPPSRGR